MRNKEHFMVCTVTTVFVTTCMSGERNKSSHTVTRSHRVVFVRWLFSGNHVVRPKGCALIGESLNYPLMSYKLVKLN